MATAAAGRKAAPANLRLAGGRNSGKDSGGRDVKEPPPFKRAPPVKPDDLSSKAGEMWDAIVEVMPDLQLLKPLDGFALQVGCETFSRWHAAKTLRLAQTSSGLLAKTSQGMGVSPLVRVESEASREFRAWCAEFGLTPAAEVKLVAATDSSASDDLF
jgi:P27 family predicted phage terminase small subunit